MHKQPAPKFKDYTRTYFSQSGKLDTDKRDELIISCTPLIKYIALRLASRLPAHVALDDLISCGIIGLIDAIDKFDISKNVQFKTYAEFRIKGAMLDELRSLDWMPRSIRRKVTDLEKTYSQLEKALGRPATDEETAKALNIELDEFYQLLNDTKSVSFMDIEQLRQRTTTAIGSSIVDALAMPDLDPFTTISLAEIRNILAKSISELPEKEKLAITLYYYEELTMREIGEIMGYTESRISQMHSKSMLRLRIKLHKALVYL
ncbi:MAG: FliA/WhiG family RNA polymerase sigma factor [Proteobacteria bacterium]|nr:FliA/WhiG family RNA polymerase sigma factor [Pseudomonadota bacterium]MBU1716216.1 FliA/WhiG family RNA polymerase sigma factor [Pseudomonadota bacterium]